MIISCKFLHLHLHLLSRYRWYYDKNKFYRKDDLTWQLVEARPRTTSNPMHGENLIFRRSNSARVYYPCEVEHVPQKGFSLCWWRIRRAGTVRNELRTYPWLGSCYRQCPTATEDDSLRGRWLLFQKRRRTRLVGDWTVPDQFGFTFRVELRVTVIDLHQGHARFQRSLQFRSFFFFFFFFFLYAFECV